MRSSYTAEFNFTKYLEKVIELYILENFVSKFLLCRIVILITNEWRIANNKVETLVSIKAESVKIKIDYLCIMQSNGTCLVCLGCHVFNCCYCVESHVFITHTFQEHTITTTWLQYIGVMSTVYSPMQYE